MNAQIETAKVGMIVRKIRSGSMYQIQIVEADSVYLRPYWAGNGSRSTWKTLTHLWRDYKRVDDTAVAAVQP